MRKIYLVDDVGATFEFNYRSGVLISGLNGLGFIRENAYLKYGNTYTLAKRMSPLSQIQATLTFLKGYDGYQYFLSYLRKIKGKLRLFYKADTLKYAFVQVVSMSKSELEFGVISSLIVFDRLSMWNEKKSFNINMNENSHSKTFAYTYPYVYSSTYYGSIEVTNASCEAAPIRLEITGIVNNPKVEILQYGQVISEFEIFVQTTKADSVIIIESEPTAQEMTLIESGTQNDIYQYQNFSLDSFLFLEVGTYTIRFSPGVCQPTRCKVIYLQQFEGN